MTVGTASAVQIRSYGNETLAVGSGGGMWTHPSAVRVPSYFFSSIALKSILIFFTLPFSLSQIPRKSERERVAEKRALNSPRRGADSIRFLGLRLILSLTTFGLEARRLLRSWNSRRKVAERICFYNRSGAILLRSFRWFLPSIVIFVVEVRGSVPKFSTFSSFLG